LIGSVFPETNSKPDMFSGEKFKVKQKMFTSVKFTIVKIVSGMHALIKHVL